MRTRRPRPAPVPRSAFAGFRFPSDVIVVAVRWYLRYALSYRYVEELLAERGVEVDHVTVYRRPLPASPPTRGFACLQLRPVTATTGGGSFLPHGFM